MTQILLLITGLALFLFGLLKLSLSMQRVISVRIRRFIKHSVRRPGVSVVLGTILTAVFQSSSATTVLVVGMVNAGLFSFFYSLPLILGADIGTTITAQLVALKITAISPLFIILGIFLWFLAKGDKLKEAGETVFYFGLLFFGLSLMGSSIAPLKQSPFFMNLIQEARNPLWGILIGFVFTGIIQSSSATTGILVLLGQKGLVTLASGLPILMGANIGTTVTALLASTGTGINGKRVAFAHFLFKFLAVAIVFPFLGFYSPFIQGLASSVPQQIALAHFIFNIFLVSLFIFLLKPFARLVQKIISGQEHILSLWPEFIDGGLLSRPGLALEAVKKELKRGFQLMQKMFSDATRIIFDYDACIYQNITYLELVMDNLQHEIMTFLSKIPKEKLSRKEAAELINYSAIVDEIERLADHATNLAKLAKHKKRAGVGFSDAGKEEIRDLKELLNRNLEDALSLLEGRDEKQIEEILSREDLIDRKVGHARGNHLERFYRREISAADGPIFDDIMINFERISDHCVNMTEYKE